MSKVYFSSAERSAGTIAQRPGKIETLLRKMNFADRFTEDEWVAIKTIGLHGAFRIVPRS